VVTCRLKIKIYIDDVIGAIAIEFYGLVFTKKTAFVPKDLPGLAPGVVYVKV
jgi:hypothetical protein